MACPGAFPRPLVGRRPAAARRGWPTSGRCAVVPVGSDSSKKDSGSCSWRPPRRGSLSLQDEAAARTRPSSTARPGSWSSRPQDARAVAGALARLLDDAELRQRLGDQARRRAVAEFDYDHLAPSCTRRWSRRAGDGDGLAHGVRGGSGEALGTVLGDRWYDGRCGDAGRAPEEVRGWR